jgi:16S rRNA (guanine(966)-N(2))-methyltransferase RsmD
MKIINGEYSGRNFFMPYGIRPSANMLRKAVFDIIGHDLTGLTVLELFSGSGAIGFEALSCGAAEVYFVDHNIKCIKVIEENIELLRPSERGLKAYVIHEDAFAAAKRMAREGKKFDIVFFDPPYGLKLAKKALKLIMSRDIVRDSSFVVAEYGIDERMPEPENGFTIIKDKTYSSSRLTIYAKAPQAEAKI